MCERQDPAHAPPPDGGGQAVPVACPESARASDITCACCGECWNIERVLRGETEPLLDTRAIIMLLLAMGCPLCEWGTGHGRRDEYKTLHLRSLLAYFLSCEPAQGTARLEMLSWLLHDIANFVRDQADLGPLAHEDGE